MIYFYLVALTLSILLNIFILLLIAFNIQGEIEFSNHLTIYLMVFVALVSISIIIMNWFFIKVISNIL